MQIVQTRWSAIVLITMQPLPKPEVILTHESDLDGFVSSLLLQSLARKLFETETRIMAYQHVTWKQRPMRERSAWVTDMGVDKRTDKDHWVVIDHHPTNLQTRFARVIHDPSKSSSLLVYELCNEHGMKSDKLDRLVHLTNVDDLFIQTSNDFDEATTYGFLVKTYGFWNLLALIGENPEDILDHPLLEVIRVKKRVEDPMGFDWAKANLLDIGGGVALVNPPVGNSNLILNRLLHEKGSPFHTLVSLSRRANGMIIASIRSRDGQALDLAEKLQGGGHPNASGAMLPQGIQNIPDAIDYLRKIIEPVETIVAADEDLEAAFNKA